MKVIAIDPGAVNTGVVIADGPAPMVVLRAATIHCTPAIGDSNLMMVQRCREISAALAKVIETYEPDVIVMEGFVGFAGRQGTRTWQTPWLCGWLAREYRDRPLFVQTSRQVLNPKTRNNCAWVKKDAAAGVEICPGSLQCTNDHERSALAHAYWFFTRKR